MNDLEIISVTQSGKQHPVANILLVFILVVAYLNFKERTYLFNTVLI